MDKETLRIELQNFADILLNGYTDDSTILELLGTNDCINDYVDNQLLERWQKLTNETKLKALDLHNVNYMFCGTHDKCISKQNVSICLTKAECKYQKQNYY